MPEARAHGSCADRVGGVRAASALYTRSACNATLYVQVSTQTCGGSRALSDKLCWQHGRPGFRIRVFLLRSRSDTNLLQWSPKGLLRTSQYRDIVPETLAYIGVCVCVFHGRAFKTRRRVSTVTTPPDEAPHDAEFNAVCFS